MSATKTSISWTDATCRLCGDVLTAETLVEFGRRLCKPCRNVRQRRQYVRKGHPGRRGWLMPTRDGDKKQARRRINYLVEQHLIARPNDFPCFDCGHIHSMNSPRRHEYDHYLGYSKQHQLSVQAVCSSCHHTRAIQRGEWRKRHGIGSNIN